MKYLALLIVLLGGCAKPIEPAQLDYCQTIGWGKMVTYHEASLRIGKATANFWFCDGAVVQDGTSVTLPHWEWFFGPDGEQMLRRVPPLIG